MPIGNNNTKRNCILSILAIGSLTLANGQVQGGLDTAAQAISTTCHEARYVLGLAEIFEAEAADIHRNFLDLQTAAFAYEIAVAMPADETTKIGRRALSLLSLQRYASAADGARAAAKTKQQAAAQLRQRAGRLLGMREAKIVSITNKGSTTATADGKWPEASTVKADISTNLATVADTNCSIDNLDAEDGPKKKDIKHDSIFKVKLLADANFKPKSISIHAVVKGSGFANNWADSNNHKGVLVNGGGPARDNFWGAKINDIENTDAPEDKDLFADADKRSACKTESIEGEWAGLSAEAIARWICRATTAKAFIPKPPTDESLGDLKTDKKLAKLILVLTKGPESPKEQEITDPEPTVKSFLGADEPSFSKTFVKYVKEEEQTLTFGQDKFTGTLLNLAADPAGSELLAYLTTAAAMKHEFKPQLSETKEEDCNKKDQKECSSPCKWSPKAEGKKCKLDKEAKEAVEKAAQETEGKYDKTTTNTTVSNSFVIKRAPLLLAFCFYN
uniref:Variant surface glycoprotein 1125.478 n=1 Tax=Trypanosoma brucei TaxID=5691 RepID=A0A1J0R630_9TRYP|nr:variant surface glycoprotein 1125.478 [Trypanosoma brucei]